MLLQPNTNLLELRDVRVSYGDIEVVRGVTFALGEGDIGCVLGPSGCGKTTLLRAIAGFEPIDAGEIHIAGALASSAAQCVAPEQRRIGLVSQDYALFPHLTVARNIAFGLRGLQSDARTQRVYELLALVGLSGLGGRFPHELSGGQQQRIALARSLAPRPALLLLDEPFSSLDSDLRERLSVELRDLIKASGATSVMVTHHQHEAFAMADVVGLMHNGAIVQTDVPHTLYHRPATRFVADFVGEGAFLRGVMIGPRVADTALGRLEGIALDCEAGCAVDVLLRPDDIVHDDNAPMQAEVVRKAFRGAAFLYTLKLPSGELVLSLVPSHHDHAEGMRIGIRLDVEHVIAFRHVD